MQQNDESPKLRLKNGAEVDARSAYIKWRMLEALHESKPHETHALLALTEGREAALSPEIFARLKQRHANWFHPDGTLVEMVRNVLSSAFRETPEGAVLVNPFQLATDTDRNTLLEIQRQDDRFLRRFLRGDDPPGNSR